MDLDREDASEVARPAVAKRAGWDYVDPGSDHPLGSHWFFAGRVGHIGVTVAGAGWWAPHPSMPAAIGARVRDRIPDLPFLHSRSPRGGQPGPGPDPCSLLTRAEAETVLGTLVAAPSRSIYPDTRARWRTRRARAAPLHTGP